MLKTATRAPSVEAKFASPVAMLQSLEPPQQGDALMKRRGFLKVSATGAAAAAAVASPAIAQSSPEIKWRMTSSFPKSLDTIYGGAVEFSKYVAAMTDNKFQIQVFSAGEAPRAQRALDATANA